MAVDDDTTPRRFHEFFETDLDIYLPDPDNGATGTPKSKLWWMVQCRLRQLATDGKVHQLQNRLQTRKPDHDRRVRTLRRWVENEPASEEDLDELLESVAHGQADAIILKIRRNERFATNRACEAKRLAHLQVSQPDCCLDSYCWVAVGKDRNNFKSLVRWLEIPRKCEQEDTARLQQEEERLRQEELARQQQEARVERERQETLATERQAEIRPYLRLLEEAREADPVRLEQIRVDFLTYTAGSEYERESFDPDADIYIPGDPSRWTREKRGTMGPEKRKAWWIAQCHFRGLATDGKVLVLIGRMRTRIHDVDPATLPVLTELYHEIRRREWRTMSDEQKVKRDVDRLLRESADNGLILRLDERTRQAVRHACNRMRPTPSQESVDLPPFLMRYMPCSDRWLVVANDHKLARQLEQYVEHATQDDIELEDSSVIPPEMFHRHVGRCVSYTPPAAKLRRDFNGAVPADALQRTQAVLLAQTNERRARNSLQTG